MFWLKKLCQLNSDTTSGDLYDMNKPSWKNLPYEILLEIYCLLPSRDRYNMALTCKQWLAPFLHPRIWRRSHFLLNSRMARRKLRRPETVMMALRSLTIDFSGPTYILTRSLPKIEEFLTCLKNVGNSSLESLKIVDLSSCCSNIPVLAVLTSVIRFQTELKALSLSPIGLILMANFVAELLATVAVNCAKKLVYLELRDELPVLNAHVLKLPAVLSRLTSLAELSVSYDFLSDEMLRSLPGSLKLLRIWCKYDDGYFIDPDTVTLTGSWTNMAAKLPSLSAEYHVTDVRSVIYLAKVLPKGVPLTRLYWQSRQRNIKVSTDFCLKYTMDTFENLLELHMDVRVTVLNEKDLATTIERFPMLKTLTVYQKSRKKRFNIPYLERVLADVFQRQPHRRLIPTDIRVTHCMKNITEVITVFNWDVRVDSVPH